MFNSSIPVLHVSSAAAAQAFYCEQLGFRQQFIYRLDDVVEDPCYVCLVRDTAPLHLSSFARDGVAGGVALVEVEDIDALHVELQGRQVEVQFTPVQQSWGRREMYVVDADGNSLRFVQRV